MDEKMRRLWVAGEAEAIGWGLKKIILIFSKY